MKNIKAIFKREFLAYFNSPVAYVIVVIFLLAVMSFAFILGDLLRSNDASLTNSFFMYHPWIYIVIAPAVGMRLWSEEQRLGTLELLMTMPISPWQAIIGKFLAAASVWLVALAMTFTIVITVFYLGSPDIGPIITGYIASYCYALACLAVTSAVSALTRNQVVCFIVSVFLCFAFTLLGHPPVKAFLLGSKLDIVTAPLVYMGFLEHFSDMTKGIIAARDLVFFVSVILVGLLVTDIAIRSKRA
jgi:ABC-2 type transport system permease protein